MAIEFLPQRAEQFSNHHALNLFNVIAGKPADDKPLNPLKVYLEDTQKAQYPEEEVYPFFRLNSFYLQYPNKDLKDLALTIVEPGDANDEKVSKITAWVVKNIQYKEDIKNYGYEEFWAPPFFTLRTRSGDCEDGAFLIHSLLLNAGVPSERLRTYGGQVQDGDGARTGGHAWTVYRRESDNEWVVVDFSYFPAAIPTDAREPMKDDKRYIDDYFFMTLYEFVVTRYVNRVRDPDGYNRLGRIRQNVLTGSLVNQLI
jgi:predicted transglutaminase-like cysteine proteinase